VSLFLGPVASFVQFFLSGPWITVECQSAMIANQPQHPECLIVRARNRGRSGATVEQWGFVIKGTLHGPTGWSSGSPLPYRLEPNGAPGSWMLDYKEARANLEQNYPRRTEKHYWDLVPFVRLSATGKLKFGRESLRIWEPGYFGPDPRHSQWWKRYSPWHWAAQNVRHGTGWIRKRRLP
jgi:hypothetical protein